MFSFKTTNKRTITLCLNEQKKQLVFRKGTQDKLELQYPFESVTKHQAFTFSYYVRVGGTANDGLDLNYIYFANDSVIPFLDIK